MTDTTIGGTEARVGTGQNTNAIIANQGAGVYAAELCDALVVGIYNDWYLPSIEELTHHSLNKKSGNINFILLINIVIVKRLFFDKVTHKK